MGVRLCLAVGQALNRLLYLWSKRAKVVRERQGGQVGDWANKPGKANRAAAGFLALSLGWTAGLWAVSATAQDSPTGPVQGLQLGPDEAPKLLPPIGPSLNFYGSAGLMDMPSAPMLPDGTFATTFSYFGGQTRTTLTFQATPWLSASFRYASINDLNRFGYSTYYDRSFDVRFRLLKESRRWPAITLGLQDFAGTGIYAGEYIVATKSFETPGWGTARAPGKVTLTGGLGWGRLASSGAIGSPFGGNRPSFGGGSTGGQLSYDQWFRGPAAPFAGIEWRPTDKWGIKAEYSSDAYVTETQKSNVFDRKSRFNFGVEYQAAPRTRLGAYYMYGSEIGFTAQFQLNPYYPTQPMRLAAPTPIQPRPSRAEYPELWDAGWAESTEAAPYLRDQLTPLLLAEGLVLETLDVSAHTAELRFRNIRYLSFSNAVGRAARVMTQVLPSSVETFRLVPVSAGMALSAVTIRRSDLEALEFTPDASNAISAVTGYGDAPPLAETAVGPEGLYPSFTWSLSPYFSPSYFDPDRPFRIDVGAELRGTWRPAPGWTVSGAIRQRIAGNVADSRRVSNSKLEPVRTNQVLYAQYGTTMDTLFGSYQWRPGKDLYGRVTVGYLEQMFGGISTELLWKPVTSRLGLGIEADWVMQRDFDQLFGFQDYNVLTGFASAYYDLGNGFEGKLDVGRYLAGDVGATASIERIFNNGWRVGGFFTKTNVSAEEFGEGSFDKGFWFSIPVAWFLGQPSQQSVGTLVRPIQRDGGARLRVAGRLYGQVRLAHREALRDQRARFWE